MGQLHGAIMSPLSIHDAHLAHQSLHGRTMNGSNTTAGRRVQWCALIDPRSWIPDSSTVPQLQFHLGGSIGGASQDI